MEIARSVLAIESEAIAAVADKLDNSFIEAISLIIERDSKVVITGIGKSGLIGQKIAATFCSTGTPAVFLHATEAVHGDLGVYSPGDPSIIISKSGSTAELLRLIPVLRQFQSPLIGILGNISSPLARQCDIVLDATITREADQLNLAPTSSSAAALAIGDALAVTLMETRRFTDKDFARFHPGGQLGRNLYLQVSDVMHQETEVAWVGPEDTLREVIIAMTQKPLGAACVVDEDMSLAGLITDGDLRRALAAHEDIRQLRAKDIMTRKPVHVSPDTTLKDAARIMEDRPSQISVLPVLDPDSQKCLGLLRIHDIYQPELI